MKYSNRQIAQIMKAYYDSLVNDLLPENFWETNPYTCNRRVKNELFETYEIYNSNFPMTVGMLMESLHSNYETILMDLMLGEEPSERDKTVPTMFWMAFTSLGYEEELKNNCE